MNRSERITLLATPEERTTYERMARCETEGNVSLLIRQAMREYLERHPYIRRTPEATDNAMDTSARRGL